MPALFVGHGNPMNAIEETVYAAAWREVSASIPRPAAILCISAHWETEGCFVTAMEQPKTHLGELSGREYLDAVVDLSKISAVIVRVKSRRLILGLTV